MQEYIRPLTLCSMQEYIRPLTLCSVVNTVLEAEKNNIILKKEEKIDALEWGIYTYRNVENLERQILF